MATKEFNKTISDYVTFIEESLNKYIPKTHGLDEKVIEAMKYSLLLGGKRIRPILTLEFFKACGGKNKEYALPFACAVEMIHSYSLIHDDLPCMDNDDMRRGRASTHIKFGEDIALLAGDALLNLAFEIMSDKENLKFIGAENVLTCMQIMAKASGVTGMIGGQAIDLMLENKKSEPEVIVDMYKRKTGAIIVAACKMGCIVAGADEKKISAAGNYAESVGLAFQVVDDILDLTSNEETLGKPVNSDVKNKKNTYVSIIGIDKSIKIIESLTEKAISSLKEFSCETSFLRELAVNLKTRNK